MKDRMKNKIFLMLFLFLNCILNNNAMEKQTKTSANRIDEIDVLLAQSKALIERAKNGRLIKPVPKTPVELLTEACQNHWNESIKQEETSAHEKIRDRAVKHKQCTALDHIRVTYLSGFLYFYCREKKYLQLQDSVSTGLATGASRREFKRNDEKIEKINALLNNSIRTFKSRKTRNASQKKDLFTAHIDLIPLQNFFYTLLPWPNRHPWILATGLTTLGVATTWAIMRKK